MAKTAVYVQIGQVFTQLVFRNHLLKLNMKKLFAFLVLVILHFELLAQGYSVDLVTGTMSTSISLFSVQDRDIQVSGALGYTGSGVKVTDVDGWVGHNWNISANSYKVTRDMRGLPDEFSQTGDERKGWLHSGTNAGNRIKNFTVNTDNNPSTCTDEEANYTFIDGFGFNVDTEPDAFHVAAPGLSFQFFFDENQEIQVIPYQDVLVEKEIEANQIVSFTVTDSRGVKFVFDAVESLTEEIRDANNYYLVKKTHLLNRPTTYNVSWRLSKMISPVNGEINFLYRTVHTLENDIVPEYFRKSTQYKYRFEEVLNDLEDSRTVFQYSRESSIQILDKIITPTQEVHFISSPKDEDSVFERLNSIEVYEKRNGTSEKIKEIELVHYLAVPYNITRAYLREVKETAIKGGESSVLKHQMFYDGRYNLPYHHSKDKDEWGFYKTHQVSTYIPYDETVDEGLLTKITNPEGAFTAFFYEPHDFWDGSSTIEGGGVRIKKAISYDGVGTNGKVKMYEYKTETGRSSGKLQHKALLKISAAKMHRIGDGSIYTNRYYRQHQYAKGYDANDPRLIKLFTLTSDLELSHSELLHGSAVAYERVIERTPNNGFSVYEFDLPASFGEVSANDYEWQASRVLIARQGAPSGYCYETPNISEGINRYPYPPNPNYDFAKGLLKKETHFNYQDKKVGEVDYEYERVYKNGSSIRKIYGLSFERLPTYYYDNGYREGRMFLYSKYQINTNVKTVIKKKTKTNYFSDDLSKKNVETIDYFYDSPQHGELTHTERLNSDGNKRITRLKYVKDYASLDDPVVDGDDEESKALKTLKIGNINGLVETTSSKLTGATERYTQGNLTTFKVIGGKVFPNKEYSFVANTGSTSFNPSEVGIVSGSTRFDFDEAYVLDNAYLSFDEYGNHVETKNRDRSVNSIIWGYGGTLPALQVSNSKLSELKYDDFEAVYPTSFDMAYGPTFVEGRAGSKGITLPSGGGSNYLRAGLNKEDNNRYNFSCWIKSSTAGTLYIEFYIGFVAETLEIPYQSSSGYQYYSINNIILNQILQGETTYNLKIWSSAAIHLDDVAYFPNVADFVAYTYHIPYGKALETDARGNSLFYDYDEWGRLSLVYDRDGNILKKYDYQVQP